MLAGVACTGTYPGSRYWWVRKRVLLVGTYGDSLYWNVRIRVACTGGYVQGKQVLVGTYGGSPGVHGHNEVRSWRWRARWSVR